MTDPKLVYLYQDLLNYTADQIEKEANPIIHFSDYMYRL